MCFELKVHGSFITSKGILLMCSDNVSRLDDLE